MKVVVFGASRGVGRCAIEQALAQGHEVTAAVRSPAGLGFTHERLRIVTCDVRDAEAVRQAMAGQEVALCTLGDATRGPTTLYSTGARNVVQGMHAQNVRRLIFLSNFGVLDECAQDLMGRALLFLLRRAIRHTLADHKRALDEIRGSAREWVVVRPMVLTNAPGTGHYRVALDGLPVRGRRIARADVAHFMVRQIISDEYVGKVPAIAY
jgi:putative NADH-flavin reductase